MTDLEELKALLDKFGVGYTQEKMVITNEITITCTEGSEKVGGYTMFFTDFTFDEHGTFEEMGAWE